MMCPIHSKNLEELLSIESLFVTTKALDVATEHEHVLCEARIVTDVRPIFGLTNDPVAAVPVHVLRIAYHEGGKRADTKDFFVALSHENIVALRAVLDRAEGKERALRKIAEKSGLRWLQQSDQETE